jgi:hypothetical protein
MPRVDSQRGERLAYAGLLTAMVLSALTLLLLGRHLTFWSDELDWLTFRSDFDPQGLLTPHGSHLIATTRVIYEGLPRIFGTSYLPFRILGVICLQAGAVLTFVLLRRRVGAAVAVFPAVVLLFFGSAQDMALSPLGIPFTLSIALGLGAFALVEQNGLRTDLGAMLLLTLSGLSHTFGTIMAFGLLVYLLLERSRRREVWIALVPLLLYVAWWIWARQFHQSIASDSGLLGVPVFIVKAAGAAIEGMLGIPPGLGGKFGPLPDVLKAIFDLVAVIAAVALGTYIRRTRGTAWLWAYIATIVAFWIGVGLAEGTGRAPDTPRYLFFGAIVLSLIAAEVFRGRAIPSGWRPWLLGAWIVALTCNVFLLFYEIPQFNGYATDVKAQVGMIELGGESVPDQFQVRELGPPASPHVPSPAGAIRAFDSDVGPLGYSLEQVREQSEPVRERADFVLARSLGIAAAPVPSGNQFELSSCETFQPGPDGYTTIPIAAGATLLELRRDTGEAGSPLLVGRFADLATVPIGTLAEDRRTIVLVPDVADPDDPWIGRAIGAVRSCTATPRAAGGADGGESAAHG